MLYLDQENRTAMRVYASLGMHKARYVLFEQEFWDLTLKYHNTLSCGVLVQTAARIGRPFAHTTRKGEFRSSTNTNPF